MDSKLIALLCRHGEEPSNRDNVFRGWMNQSLDETGEREAHALVKELAKYPVDRIVSSPLKRALQTAEIIADALTLEISQEGALLPFNTGFLTGQDKDEFKDIYEFYVDNPDLVIPRGESIDGQHDRIGDYFEHALRNPRELILYSCHSSTAVCLHNLVKGKYELQPGDDHLTEPGGLVAVYQNGNDWEIKPLTKVSEK